KGDYDAAIVAFREAIRLKPDLATAHFNLGYALSCKGQWAEAIREYKEALHLAPDFATGNQRLAWVLATCPDAKQRDAAVALELAQKAVKLAPKDGASWTVLGVAQYSAGEWKAAAAALEKSQELPNRFAAGLFFLAMAHHKLGHRNEALKWFDKAVQWM